MKLLNLLFLVASLFILQNAIGQQSMPTTHASLLTVAYSSRLAQLNSNGYHFSMDDADKCHRFTIMKKAGLGLTIGGGACFVTGLAMVAAGAALYDPTLIVAGGVTFGVLGIPALGAGIPLLIIGSHKAKQYCSNSSLNLSMDRNGVGLACNF